MNSPTITLRLIKFVIEVKLAEVVVEKPSLIGDGVRGDAMYYENASLSVNIRAILPLIE